MLVLYVYYITVLLETQNSLLSISIILVLELNVVHSLALETVVITLVLW